MEDSISRKLRLAHEKYLNGFLASDPEKMAELAGGHYENGVISMKHFNEVIQVHCADGTMAPRPNQLLEEVLILKYLQEAQGMEGPGSDYIAFIQLPCGSHHIKAFKAEVTDVLANTFGGDFPGFIAICEALGGEKADDEFPAAANFLFDNKCTFHMDTDGLNELANATAERLAEAVK